MIYPYTATLHGVMAILCLASLTHLFRRKKYAASETVRAWFNWFLLFFLYNLILAVPLVILEKLDLRSGIFYNVALAFLALAVWQAFNIAIQIGITDEKRRKAFSFLFIAGASLAVLLHFAFPEIPTGTPNGKWVLWYSSQPISLSYTFFMFVAGWTFAWVHFKGMTYLSSPLLRLRSLAFALGAFVLPFSAFYYFGAQKLQHIYLGFSFSIIGLIFFALGNMTIGVVKSGRES